VITDLAKTERAFEALYKKSAQTEEAFEQLKKKMAHKSQQIDHLILENKAYFEQLDQGNQEMERQITGIVQQEMAEEKKKLIRMDYFVEYFPTALSLIAFASILYFIFRK